MGVAGYPQVLLAAAEAGIKTGKALQNGFQSL
jgi:hypothetical protein